MVERNTPINWIWPAVMLGIYTALTAPVWVWLWQEWWHNDYYSHGLLVVGAALYLVGRRLANQPMLPPLSGSNWGLGMVTAALLAYLYFYQDRALYLAGFAAIALLAGLVWAVGGRWWLVQLRFPLAFLLLAVPLPFVERATLPLALWTGLCSGALVQWLGLDAIINGAAVTLPNANLVIGAQCSGINSLIALVSLMALAAYAVQGPWWGRLALVISAVPLALLGNILRVSNLLFVARYLGADAAFHFYHNYSGLIFFGLILLLMIPLARLLQCHEFRSDVL